MQLRPYQSTLLAGIRDALGRGARCLAILPTGGGKTVIFSKLIKDHNGPAVAMAHRKELIAQISRSLAAIQVTHRIIAPPPTVRWIVASNSKSFGQSYYSPTAEVGVASVDALKSADPVWMRRVTMFVCDEGHHALETNKWGRALLLFPNAAVCGVSANGERGDGKGLGRHAHGIYDELVMGPPMRELIDAGHLSEYRIFAPESTRLDLSAVEVGSTGDFKAPAMRAATKAAGITGDVVATYLKHCKGQLGLTFVADVAAAEETAQAYRDAGVPAAALSANTPAPERADMIRRFARREVMQLCNVDLFGEGFDLSSAAGMDVCVDCVSMVRPTASYVVMTQQFGRALRNGPGKTRGTIIDHVGNVARHNPPDFPRHVTLDARPKRGSGRAEDVPLVRVCKACTGVYRRELSACPYCGFSHVPAERGSPDAVDGDLIELDPAVLDELRRVAERAVWGEAETREHYASQHIPAIGVAANVKRQRETTAAQLELRDVMANWAGVARAGGADDAQIYRRFFLSYGVDMATAQGLKSGPAAELMARVVGT